MWRASGCVPRPCPNRAKWSISRLPNTMMLMGEKTCWTNCQIIEDTIGLIKLVYDDLKFKHLSFPVSNLQNAVFEITTRLTTSSLCLIFAVKHTRSSNRQPSIWGFWPWFLSASEGETQKSSRKVGQIWHTSMELLPKTVNNLTISFQSSYCFFLCFFQCINDHKKFNLKSQKFAKNFLGASGFPNFETLSYYMQPVRLRFRTYDFGHLWVLSFDIWKKLLKPRASRLLWHL